MKKIGIIGAGFSGMMTAVHLIEKAVECEIVIFNDRDTFARGIAFNPYSDKHLLNVITAKMSAYADEPAHFLDWVMDRPEFFRKDRELIANSFMPRSLYGQYLLEIWNNAAPSEATTVTLVESDVTGLEVTEDSVTLSLENDGTVTVDYCVVATGNNVPRNPRIVNMAFYDSPNYFQNPWKESSVLGLTEKPVLIVGNGLTMVDTVLSLLEQGFKGDIYSVSPNGFNILPHKHIGLKYTKMAEELSADMSLLEVIRVVNKHIKMAREHGVSAEPVIDSLRPYTQKLWHNFSQREKNTFMARLRHLWGTARHRIPLYSYDKLQQLREEGRLTIFAANLLDINQSGDGIRVTIGNRKEGSSKDIIVERVINCTGPESDFSKLESGFLKESVLNGTMRQDNLKLGIVTDITTFAIIGPDGNAYQNLFTVGGNLKGELWESTAVHELREQAEKLAGSLAAKITTEAPALI